MKRVSVRFSDDEYNRLKTSNFSLNDTVRMVVRRFFNIPDLGPDLKREKISNNKEVKQNFYNPPKQNFTPPPQKETPPHRFSEEELEGCYDD